jgi:hypothetical protein
MPASFLSKSSLPGLARKQWQGKRRGRLRLTVESLEERLVLSANSQLPALVGPQVPAGWAAADVGSPGRTGGASFDGIMWTVQGGGTGVGGTADQLEYVYQTVRGNASIIAQVTSVQNTSAAARGGVMFRDGAAAGAPEVFLAELPNGQVELQWRQTAGGTAAGLGPVGPAGVGRRRPGQRSGRP